MFTIYENFAILAGFVFIYSITSGGLERTPINGALVLSAFGLALAGMNIRADEKLFMGWFGPRGLVSIVFAVIVLKEHLPGGGIIAVTVVCSILLGVIAHGLSANSLVALLVARLKGS